MKQGSQPGSSCLLKAIEPVALFLIFLIGELQVM